MRSGRPEILRALRAGDPVDPADYYFRLGVHLETGDPVLAHLEHHIYMASALREPGRVRYTAYRVT